MQEKKIGYYGSGICINLTHLDKIPAFYNPPEARGEDAFFSTWLGNANIVSVPTYHFHDGFLQHTQIMKEEYPQELSTSKQSEKDIEKRFWEASKGWVKYKPLLIYILEKDKYKDKIDEMRYKLQISIPKVNKIFTHNKFDCLLEELDMYDKNVEKHYEEYKKVKEIWNKIKSEVG